MKSFAEAWPEFPMLQQAVATLPWGHNVNLLDKLQDPDARLWYAAAAVENAWSRNVLAHHIATKLHERSGKAITSFKATLPSSDSDLAQQSFKDPYVFDFVKLRSLVVVELKATAFKPEYLGQINMCMSAVDDLLAHADDQPTIGLLLCKTKNNVVAEYSLRGFSKPIGIAEWESEIVASLPEEPL